MRQAAYNQIAHAVRERYDESRSVARRKVIELAADFAAVLAHEDPHFSIPAFYRACGFGLRGDDIAMINDRPRAVDFAALGVRAAADRGDDQTHQGYANYETFLVCTYLDNDRTLLRKSRDIARKAAAEDAETGDVQAADALRKWYEATQLVIGGKEPEDVLIGNGSSMLYNAISNVDWLQVARTRLEITDAEAG